ncbi:glycosyltransferase family 2 protein [Pseudooceanicola aestuarii]|uniref:glycosyltransferase family 2 protein n=1 Tax=Pseudooceanicola aestuarii TaxID=2697319 RepID=UPI0013D3F069|nr:glycosyltransferase family 2 protein [Pseudooceanicola aestuarii]
MRDAPLITIGMTAYNARLSIRAAIASALGQCWQRLELVIVDDASTDGTGEILTALAERDRRIRVIRLQRNGGVARARNHILAVARGSHVAFFDDDDVSEPDRIRVQFQSLSVYEAHHSGGAPVLCHTARRQVFRDGRSCVLPALGQSQNAPGPSGPSVARRILMGAAVPHATGTCATSSQFARRETYVRAGGFDPALRRSEDTDLAVRLARAGAHFLGLPSPLVIQQMSPGADKTLAQEHQAMRKILAKHRDFIAAHGDYDFVCRWLDLKFRAQEHGAAALLAGLLPLAARHPWRCAHRLHQALPRRGERRAQARFRRAISRAEGGI